MHFTRRTVDVRRAFFGGLEWIAKRYCGTFAPPP